MNDIDEEIKNAYDKYTTKFSDICRNIVFALLAFVWLFCKNTSDDQNIYFKIFWDMIIYLIVDAIQYLFTVLFSFAYYHIFRISQKNARVYMLFCTWISFLIFISKIILLAYILTVIKSNLVYLK